jgi:hypothetical protein
MAWRLSIAPTIFYIVQLTSNRSANLKSFILMTSKKDENPFIHQAVLPVVSQGHALARWAQIILWKQGGISAMFHLIPRKKLTKGSK